ncbi:MAG: PIN domain nuclease [Actinomycetota bacterium]
MAVAASYLLDNSALARYGHPAVTEVLGPRIARGLVGVTIVTELEAGYSAQSAAEYDQLQLFARELIRVEVTPKAEQRARTIQERLVHAGRHRAVSVADILLAAIAYEDGLTVLHYDGDFDFISGITGQPSEWVVPRGSV